jgi:YhcN/YlaJ family sporulation lipoprotein
MNQAVQHPNQVTRQGVQKMNQGAHNLANRTGLKDNRTGTVHDRIEIADRAATNIVKVRGVRAANVLVTRNNAYVAAALVDNRQKITGDVEKQIANQVRKADPRIQQVYVSTNPQFVERVRGYVRDVRQGRPVTGFAQEFSQMVARIFPTAK